MGGLQATGQAGLKDGAREQRGRVEGGNAFKFKFLILDTIQIQAHKSNASA
jgi:hypothetical protein